MSTSFNVHVYKVSGMAEVRVSSAKDDVDALAQAIQAARGNFVPVKPDCRFIAILPSGARRDMTDKRGRPRARR